ncbi:MAG: ribose-phosphate pyrophosphokinase [Candidatus Levybacteria bacterium]|nr:ribose-phosphate pyrophosphokinase [Candidatus Levybacteria bacterium]MBI2420790.1 ribose-phosphate pyrophosphokinase [Candidatus Levybacteria bacterium]
MLLYSGTSNISLAKKIASSLNQELGNLEIHIFPDGERRVRVEDNVVDRDVVVIQTTSPKPELNYFELFFIADALKRSGAKSVTAVVAYLGYQRQDHVFRSGEAVSMDVIIKNLESLGIDKVITFDLHSIKIPELFKIPVVHLSALPIFAEEIKKITNNKFDEAVLVSPDMGGIRRIEMLSDMLGGISSSSIIKNRDLKSGNIESAEINGEVKQVAFVVDDMISTGRTIIAGANLLKEKGTEEVYVFATHPVFSFEDKGIFDEDIIKRVFVTDTIEIDIKKKFEKLEVLSIANLIAEELKKQ